MLDVVLLVVCICIVIVLITYLFYWNRFIGLLIGLFLRLSLWNQGESSIWVDIGAVHISILGGRVLFKDLRYYSSNQTIKVVKGQISWRYWIRAPAEEEDLSHERVVGEDTDVKHSRPLACRVHVSLQGLEWFLYNRTAAYDNIISVMESTMSHTPQPPDCRRTGDGRVLLRKIFSQTSQAPESSLFGPPGSLTSSLYKRTPSFIKRSWAWIVQQLPNLDPKDLLPISIQTTNAAITCGNPSTRSLLVVEFQQAVGTYGIVPSRSKYDLYKQMLKLIFKNASIYFVDNKDFRASMNAEGNKVHNRIHRSDDRALRQYSYLSFPVFQNLWRHLKLWEIAPTRTRSHVLSGVSHTAASWNRRKVDTSTEDETPVGADWVTLEYAKERKILESPVLELLYYADVVGVVPLRSEQVNPAASGLDPFDIGNGDLPPEWGIDLALKGGFLRYGPWADRQRSELQQTFFPPTFSNVEPYPRLKPGDSRIWTTMKVFIELRDGVVLQIPFREASKNWQWDGHVEVPNRPKKREAASIHVKAGDSSTISYFMPMVAGSSGYEPTLEVHLDTVTVTSSLNDIRLIEADTCRVRGELPSPLKWQHQRKWEFSVSLRSPAIYLLRDHVNMLTDLGRDWSSGPPSNFHRFIPVLYVLNVDLQNYEINTYVNDQNIIDKPLIKEDNALLTLRGNRFQNVVHIPLTKFRPTSTAVSFRIDAPNVAVSLTLPRWNTHSLYPTPHRSDIGRIGNFHLDASYRYFAEVRSDNIDQLKLSFSARDVVYKACGWTIRHFMILRDNYFGSFTHFSTLFEYLQKRKSGKPVGDPIDLQYREGSSNSMQVELALAVESGLIIVPAGLPGYEAFSLKEAYNLDDIDMGASMMLALPSLHLQLRTTEYYMEMSLNIDSLTGHIEEHCSEKLLMTGASQWNQGETFIIDGIDIMANRLFGHQPHTATYVCMWEIHIGGVRARLSASKCRILLAAGSAFGLNFADPLNSPASDFAIPVDPDVTFLKITLDTLDVIWDVGSAAVEVALPEGLRLDSNDVAGQFYRKVTSLRVPQMSIRTLVASQTSPNVWYEALSFTADSNLDIYSAPPGWREKALAQTAFVAEQDKLTGRAKFLYDAHHSVKHGVMAPGRGFLDSELYLPQLRIPSIDLSKSKRIRGNPEALQPTHYTVTRAVNYSESESEQGITDADRDARLAKSRPPVIVRTVDNNDSLSSGDESDNADLTDYSSDSDDADILFEQFQESWPAVGQYIDLTRRYKTQSLQKPSMWDESPYTMTRDRISSFRDPSRSPREQGHSATCSCELKANFSEAVDTTVFRFLCKREINMWFTPLVLPVVERLVEDLNSNQLSPELRFDAIMASHIKTASPPTRVVQKTSVFDLYLPSIQVNMVQFASPMKGDAAVDRVPQILTSIGLSVGGLQIKGETGSYHDTIDTSTLHVSFATLSAQLQYQSASSKASHFAQAASISFSTHSVVSWGNKKVAVSLGELCTEFQHGAPEIVLASAIALLECAGGLATAHRNASTSAAQLDRQIIYQVISFSLGRTIIDPLSTIQPSYLIQSGRPHQLRTDLAFRFLVYLRNCLRYLEVPERRAILAFRKDAAPPISAGEVKALLETQMQQAGMDEMPIFPRQTVLGELFSYDDVTTSDFKTGKRYLQYQSCSLHIAVFRVILCHLHDETRSEFRVEKLAFAVWSKSAQWSQPPVSSPPKRSSIALNARDKGREVRQVAVSLSVSDVALAVFPELVVFVQSVVRVNRNYKDTLASLAERFPANATYKPSHPPASTSNTLILSDVVLSSRTLRFKAAAENLVIEYMAFGVTYSSTSLIKLPTSGHSFWGLSMNHTLTFTQIRLQACAVGDMSRPKEYAVLSSITLDGGRANVLLHQDHQEDCVIKAILGLNSFHLNVPRSALRLYRFMEEWKADYLPGIDATVRALLSEFKREPKKSQTPIAQTPQSASSRVPSEQSKSLMIRFNLSLCSFRVSLQVMQGTWLSWETCKIIGNLASPSVGRRTSRTFGLQIGSQRLSVSSSAVHAVPSDIRVKLDLPGFTMTGRHDEGRVHALALVEFFHLTIKPTHWDTLLSVQQKFGQDFNDLAMLIQDTRRRKATTPADQNQQPSSPQLQYNLLIKVQGFRIGLEGLSSTLFLECKDIGGGISQDHGSKWHINLFDLALSLAPHSETFIRKPSFDRDLRSAFVIVDFEANMGHRGAGVNYSRHLNTTLTKFHAVMQPSSIGELGDFVDHLQAEVLIRKERRASELADFKAKTRSILRTFDVKIGDNQQQDLSWWDTYTINLNMRNIGIVFPLALNQSLQVPQLGSQDVATVRAFLFSIKSIVFGTQRGESGQVTMKGFSFQFVSHFRQSESGDFSGDGHPTRNRLLYPEMTAQLRSEPSSDSRRIRIGADVDGFILDVDSTIPDYVSSLIDVYRQGKERVERLANAIPRHQTIPGVPVPQQSATEHEYSALLTSNILVSLTFASGKVRMYNTASRVGASSTRSKSAPMKEPSDEQFRELGGEVFNLPVVSVWGEYRATPAAAKLSSSKRQTEPSMLLFKSTIHSSQNTLRPTLLPFFTELISRAEDHMRKASWRDPQSSPLTSESLAPIATGNKSEMVGDAVQISLSLRIDQSKLVLTCQPDVNVIGGLHWDSGGFIVNISPGARRVTFTGSVGGLTAGLKHGFLSEDCVRLDAHNLAFTMNFAKMDDDAGNSTSSVSVVVDTEFSGGVRFSRLQDVLCFKAVWLDRIPIFSSTATTPTDSVVSRSASHISSNISPHGRQEVVTVVLLRLRRIHLDVDLGQSISTVELDLTNTLIRTKMTEHISEASFFISNLSVDASGNLSGHVHTPDFRFQTVRRSGCKPDDVSGGRMLDLTMTSGPLDIELDSEYMKLIHYRAEPIQVMIYDDWSMLSSTVTEEERRVRLTFTVTGTDVVAIMNVGTIPRLVSYATKFMVNLGTQREGASKESKAFRMATLPKPDNPLSAVANAMLSSARSRINEAQSGLSYAIAQRMSLRLDFLRLVVFPRSMRDAELAQFIGCNVHAHLDRLVESSPPAKRDLHLSFTSMAISKLSQLNHALVAKEKEKQLNGKDWLLTLIKGSSEATIFGLPSMNMWMRSEESSTENARVILYDFSSTFSTKDKDKDKEDIYITLNMSLYSWLTILRKSFAREMDQVQAAADLRNAPSLGSVPSTALQRRKTPEALSLATDKGIPPPPASSPDALQSHPPSSSPLPIKSRYETLPMIPQSPGDLPTTVLTSSPTSMTSASPVSFDLPEEGTLATSISPLQKSGITYQPRSRQIERLTMRQLGEATPDVMHPFFMKKAGFSLEDSLPQYVHEYATMPTEEIMKALLKLYSRQLKAENPTESKS